MIRKLALIIPLACLAALLSAGAANADTLTIKRPGSHPRYIFEAEPHLLVGFIDAPGPADDVGYGLGFRGTVEIIRNGFVPTINNSIGIGFGVDWMIYDRGDRLICRRFNPNPAVPGDCLELDEDNETYDYLYFPVVLQWNFWLSRNWSVFGEPGVMLRYSEKYDGDHELKFNPLVFYAGGRFHFSDTMALTLRLGYPTFSVGVSFLF